MSTTYPFEAGQTPLIGVVAAANDLTARWCAEAGTTNFALSGAGVWPLLGLLASAAVGETRVELERAIGRSARTAQGDAVTLIDRLRESHDAAAALGLWLPAGMRIHDRAWAEALPPDVVGTWTDQAQLDSWTAAHTHGMITRFPVHPDPMCRLIIACALAVQTRWVEPFTGVILHPVAGAWAGRAVAGLTRSSVDIDQIAALDGPRTVTRATVTGAGDVDVHLLLGAEDDQPGQILGTALSALGGGVPTRLGCELTLGPPAPGIDIHTTDAPRTELDLTVPAFDIASAQDICADPALFGLTSAKNIRGGQFPALDKQLYVSCAGQQVVARFDADGFHAAALSSTVMTSTFVPGPGLGHNVRIVATYDRPFGFLAVHRPTGLALVAGWINQP